MKTVRRVVFALALLSTVCMFCIPTLAEGTEEDKVLEAFSEAASSTVEGDLTDELSGSAEDMAQATLEMLSPKRALSEILGIGYASLPRALKLLCVLLGVVTISAVCNFLGDAMSGASGRFGFWSYRFF